MRNLLRRLLRHAAAALLLGGCGAPVLAQTNVLGTTSTGVAPATGYLKPVLCGGVDGSGYAQLFQVDNSQYLYVDIAAMLALPAGTNTIGYVGASNSAVTLLASTTDSTAHTVTATAVTGLGFYKQIQILLSVTAAATAANDTLDVYVDTSPDAGTTWVNTIHFNQVLGNGGAVKYWAVVDPAGSAGTSTVAATSDASAGTVRPSMFTDRLRVRYTIVSGTTASFTFAVLAYAKG